MYLVVYLVVLNFPLKHNDYSITFKVAIMRNKLSAIMSDLEFKSDDT